MMERRLDYILQKQRELEDATSEIAELRTRAVRDEAEKASHSIRMTT